MSTKQRSALVALRSKHTCRILQIFQKGLDTARGPFA
jgi:hypothetical protein